MSSKFRKRASRIAGARAVIFAVAGSVAPAAMPSSTEVINVCYGKLTGILRVIDAETRRRLHGPRLRARLGAVVVAIAALTAVPSAGAITNGVPDGDGHPYVGVLAVEFSGEIRTFCSGVLVAPTVFVTAGHCSGLVERFGLDKAWVSFASQFDASTSPLLAIGAAHTAFTPDFGVKGLDLGVLLLAEPVGGVTPASLPREGLLDELRDARTLAGSEFTNVGYGSCGVLVGGGPPTFCPGGIRRVSTSPFMALNASWLRLHANHAATGEGGGCFGDSGGPQLLGETIVSISSSGDGVCKAYNVAFRLDTPAARAFLDDFVALPS